VGTPMKNAKNRNRTPTPRNEKKCTICCPVGSLQVGLQEVAATVAGVAYVRL
jgi:hypothetical protein